jgi:hypothetical protein
MGSSVLAHAWDEADVPQVVSPTKQVFRGEAYYLCGFYFQRDGRRLHRVVWQAINGSIPDGCHVHHRDGNRANNHPINLEMLAAAEHLSHHFQETAEERIVRWNTGLREQAQIAAAEWHRSEAGRQWHRLQYRRTAHKLHQRKGGIKQCDACNKDFEALNQLSRFCNPACAAAHRRSSGIDDVERSCALCGAAFAVNRYSRKECCSRSCGTKLSHQRRRALEQPTV